MGANRLPFISHIMSSQDRRRRHGDHSVFMVIASRKLVTIVSYAKGHKR
jgi:hypothetical protein